MVDQIKPTDRSSNPQYGTVLDQKLFNSDVTPIPVVVRKQEVASAREEIPREEVERAAEKINHLMGIMDKRLKFTIHETSGTVMLNVIDLDSGEVINEIPSRKLLDFLGSFRELVGLLVDKHV